MWTLVECGPQQWGKEKGTKVKRVFCFAISFFVFMVVNKVVNFFLTPLLTRVTTLNYVNYVQMTKRL